MLREVTPTLWIGGETDCAAALAMQSVVAGKWAGILHACKYPCHARILGYGGKVKLESGHPEYLAALRPGHLYLNVIDPPIPLFRVETFTRALDFLDACAKDPLGRPALVHCNQAGSRAPSIALVWMAKRAELLPDDSFAVAREVFLTRVPGYVPGAGLVAFLTERWKEIR